MRYDWDENKRAETLELHSVDFASNAPEIIIPTAEEDAIIDAGIAEDPDAFEVDDEWIANPKPSYEAVPHILERYRSARREPKEHAAEPLREAVTAPPSD